MSNNNPPSEASVFLRLVVDDAAASIDFYIRAFEAEEILRFDDGSGKIVHAEIRIGDTVVSLSESDGDKNQSPSQVGGSPVIAMLNHRDPDAVAARMVENGGTAIFAMTDQPYGRRDGRYADPEGHLWLLGRDSEALSNDEIQERLDGSA